MSFGAELKDFVSGFSTGFHLRDRSKARQDWKDQQTLRASGLRSQEDIAAEQKIINEGGSAPGTGGPRDTTATPSGGVVDNTPPGQRAAERYDFAVNDLGYTPQMAAAMVGNTSIESGNFDPNVTNFTRLGDNGQSHGEFQWRGDRYTGPNGLLAWSNQNKLDPKDWKTQWRFADHELKTSHRAAYDGMMRARTPAEANDQFAMRFEVAKGSNTGDPNKIIAIDKRRAITNNMFTQFASSGTGLRNYAGLAPGKVQTAALPPVQQAIPAPKPVLAAAAPVVDTSTDPTAMGGADADLGYDPNDPNYDPNLGYAAGGPVAPTMRVYTQPGIAVNPPSQNPAPGGAAIPWTPRRVGDMPSWGSSAPNPSEGIQQKFRDMLAARAAQKPPTPAVPVGDYSHQAYLNASQDWYNTHQPYWHQERDEKGSTGVGPNLVWGRPMQEEYAWQQAQPGFGQWYKSTYGVDPPVASPNAIHYAEGGYVDPNDLNDPANQPRQAIQVGQFVPPTRYRELSPGGAPVRPETSMAWRLEASLGERQRAMDRLEKRDKTYTEYKPKPGVATPLPPERPASADAAAPPPSTGTGAPKAIPVSVPTPPERPAIPSDTTPASEPVVAGGIDPMHPPGGPNYGASAPLPAVAPQVPPADPLLAPQPFPQGPGAPYTMPSRPGQVMPTPPTGAVPPATRGAPLPQQAIPPTVVPPGVRAVSGYAPAVATVPAYAGQGDATFSHTPDTPGGPYIQDVSSPQVAFPGTRVASLGPQAIPTSAPTGDPLYPERGIQGGAQAPVVTPGQSAPVPPAAPTEQQPTAKPIIPKGKELKGADIVTPEENAPVVAAGLKHIQSKITQPPAAPPGAPAEAIPTQAPAPAPDPASGKGAYEFANNEGALTNDEYKALARQVDPEGKLAEAQRIMKVQHDLFDFYVAKGYPAKAAAASGAVLMYGRRVSQLSGNMAQAAIEANNLPAAGYWLAKAYETLPDGKELRVGKQLTTEGGQPALHYQVLDLSTGKVETDDTATADEIMTMAKGLSSGALWAKETLAIAQGIPTSSRRGVRSSATNQATLEYLTKLGDLGEKIRGTPAGPERDALVSQYDELENEASAASARVSALRAARVRWGIDPAKQTEAEKKRGLSQQSIQERQAKLDSFDQQIADAPDDASKKNLSLQKFEYLSGNAYNDAASGNKGVVKVGAIANVLANEDVPPDESEKTAFMSIGRDFMQANRGDAANAVMVLRQAFDPATKMEPLPSGKVKVGSMGEFFFSPNMLRNIYGIRNAKKPATPPASSQEADIRPPM